MSSRFHKHDINRPPENRKEPVNKLRNIIKVNLPKGFVEGISYGMIGLWLNVLNIN